MKKFVTLFIIILFNVSFADAQNFLNNLQKDVPGEGKISVHQSQDIDELINGKHNTPIKQVEQPIKKPVTTHPATENKESKNKTKTHESVSETKTNETTTPKNEAAPKPNASASEDTDIDIDIPTVDLRKKVMRQSYKVTGYRVQAFAGGNNRTDRQKAQNIGNDIKMNFPDQPIYVHFYSPRWICRVGNYRSYEEAHKMLIKIQKMGYKQACIVKGKVSIQY